MKHSPNDTPSIKKANLIAPMLVCSLLHLSLATAQSPEFDDTRENGPFDQRYFARIKGTPPTPTPEPQTPQVKPAVDLVTEALLHKSKKVDMTPTPDAATPQQAPPPLWGTQVA